MSVDCQVEHYDCECGRRTHAIIGSRRHGKKQCIACYEIDRLNGRREIETRDARTEE